MSCGPIAWDVGCYPVSLVRMLAGRRARRAFAFARWDRGVDTTLAGTLDFDGELIAQIACSFGTTMHRHALVAGADGVAECGFYNHPPADGATISLRRGGAPGYASETITLPARDGFAVEAAAFAALVATGSAGDSGMTADESIDTLAMIEALLESARRGVPVDVARD